MSTAIVERDKRMRAHVMNENVAREIRMALPEHVPVERFQRVLMTSVIHDHKLANADPMKIVKAALKVAPLGLLTDPLLGEAYLVADGNGDVQVRVGYRGLLKLARQSERVAAIYAHEVREKDEVDCELGDAKRLRHRPLLFGERGEVIGYYAVVKYLGGETDFEPMTRADIDRIRDKSDGYKAFVAKKIKDTPWHSSYDEMAKKTVLRRLLKRVPTSPDLVEAIRHEAGEDEVEYGGQARMRDVTPATRGAATLDEFAGAGAQASATPDEDGVIQDQVPASAYDAWPAEAEGATERDREPGDEG